MNDRSPDDRYFKPLPDGNDPDIPESVTGEDAEHQQPDNPFPINSNALSTGTWKLPLAGITALILLVFAWELSQLYQYLKSIHWLLSLCYLGLLTLIAGLCANSTRRYLNNIKKLNSACELRQLAGQMLETHSTIHKQSFLKKIHCFYSNQQHDALLAKSLQTLPDYCDDHETVTHISQHFLNPLDNQALASIARCSRDNAVFISLSPYVTADMVLSLWRTLKMIDEVSRIYGIAPTLPGRFKLGRQLLEQMAMTASADILVDQLMDFTSNKLANTLSKQAATGVGLGLYSMRIGFYAMKTCRPVPFQDNTQPNLKKVWIDIIKSIRKRHTP
ncbi:TIGR01620 family protein [Endozoicomonas sp. Mp262]|uniref:TIGR01620 family protein n=1 Tax=Endozoicomonas sp. Mp262 TaxID=2919499 RepID=UPI0021D8D2E3